MIYVVKFQLCFQYCKYHANLHCTPLLWHRIQNRNHFHDEVSLHILFWMFYMINCGR